MTGSELLLCPVCGWTGQRDGLNEQRTTSTCPACGEVFDHLD